MRKLIFLVALMLPLLVLAQIPDPPTNSFVEDLTGHLSSDQILALNQKIQHMKDSSSVEMGILLIDKLPDNMEIEEYALQVGRKWHIGTAGNSLLYVAALSQHKQRLEVGSKMQGTIPDVEALEIIDGVKPYFRAGDFYSGVASVIDAVQGNIDVEEQRAFYKQQHPDGGTIPWLFIALGFIAASVAGFFLIRRHNKKQEEKYTREREEREEERYNKIREYRSRFATPTPSVKKEADESSVYIPPPVYVPPVEDSSPSSSYNSSSSDDSSSSSNDSFSFGGSDSFSGGGASNDW